jgi:type I restriction enzyme S subunit
MNDELPEGWAHCPVEKVFRSFGGGTPNKGTPAYWSGNIPWLSSGDIKTERIHTAAESITRAGLENSSANLCRPGSVLVVVRSGILKHTLPVALLEREAAINQDIKCFDSGSSALNEWLSLALRTSANDILALNRDGTTVQSVKYETLKEFDLSIPPLAEQKRIVAKLEKLSAQVDACQKRLAKIPALLKRFRQSVLAAACSGRLTADWREENPSIEPASEILRQIAEDKKKVKLHKSRKISGFDQLEVPFDIPITWALCVFEDLSAAKPNAIKAGPFGSSLTKACYVSRGFKVYGQEQVINGDPNFGDYFISEEKFRELQSCEVSAGDILVSLVGTIGKVLIIPKKFQPGIINPRLAKFSLHSSVVQEYIANYLLSPLAKNMLAQQSHGGTMEILNLSIMRSLAIPLPPLSEQQEIVRRVESLFALVDRIEAQFVVGRKRVDSIAQSILTKAFRGELVPTEAELAKAEGRSFESAEELLTRISDAHVNGGSSKQRKQRSA